MGVHLARRKTICKAGRRCSPSAPRKAVADDDGRSAYATFATDGVYCKPIAVLSITAPTARSFAVPKQDCKRVVEQDVAAGVTTHSSSAVLTGNGTGTGARSTSAGRRAARRGRRTTPSRPGSSATRRSSTTAVWVGTPLRQGPGASRRTSRVAGRTRASSAELRRADLEGDHAQGPRRRCPSAVPGAVRQGRSTATRATCANVAGSRVERAQAATLEDAGLRRNVGRQVHLDVPAGRRRRDRARTGTTSTRARRSRSSSISRRCVRSSAAATSTTATAAVPRRPAGRAGAGPATGAGNGRGGGRSR